MARTDERFKLAYNSLLDFCNKRGVGADLPSESLLAKELDVSRTIVRSALKKLQESGIVRWEGRSKSVMARATKKDRFTLDAPPPTREQLEQRFFDWILRFDVPAGTALNVTQLSRALDVAPYALQEFLASFSRFGLVQRREKGGWELVGFTEDFAVELFEFRSMIELNAVSSLLCQPPKAAIWDRLSGLKEKHLTLARELETRYHDFSKLDQAFHEAINSVVKNRFISEFQKIISLIFHYHYQWEKNTEQERNKAAIGEHLALIEALESGDEPRAIAAATAHLATAKRTLLDSMRTHKLT